MNIFTNAKTFEKAFVEQLEHTYAVDFDKTSAYQQYVALGTLLKEHIAQDWNNTNKIEADKRQVYYFSMEFLMGRMITNNLMNAGVYDVVKETFDKLGLDINEIEHKEADAGLGNGGFWVDLPLVSWTALLHLRYQFMGNCMRYRYGFFKQKIRKRLSS